MRTATLRSSLALLCSPAVAVTEDDDGFQFLCDHGLRWVREDLGGGKSSSAGYAQGCGGGQTESPRPMSISNVRRAVPQRVGRVTRVPAYSSSARIASIWSAEGSNSTASGSTSAEQIVAMSVRIAVKESSPLRSRSRSRVAR